MMNLDDEKSKKIAEILKSETCKKILDYLAENKEKSEEDISKELNVPLNTVEYNLKKLVDSGLVEKSKNFFWSKKGKKINLYKPANRHIVISPKKRPSMNLLKTIVPLLLIGVALLAAIAFIPDKQDEISQSNDFKTFNSLNELENFLKENQEEGVFYGTDGRTAGIAEAAMDSGAPSGTAGSVASASAGEKSADDYSTTNIQVEGVDEPDLVKNDGKYIYVIAGNQVIIINAYPAENMEKLSEINISNAFEMFINGDKLIVFSSDYSSYSETIVSIYDISDKTNPELEKKISVEGNYVTARMIDEHVYLIANQYTGYDDIILPYVAVDGVKREIPVTDIAYFPYPDTNYVFTNILAVNIEDGEYESKTYLAGASYNIYVSEDNIYLTYTKTISYQTFFEDVVEEVYIPLLPSKEANDVKEIMDSDKQYYEKAQEVSEIIEDYSNSLTGTEKEEFDIELYNGIQDFSEEFQKKTEKTVIHKISVDNLDIDYITNGEVPGHILNQFSMDEHEGYFRIATTTGNSWGSRAPSLNHMYVLDANLKIVGSVEDLAKGEQIYSTRFMGDRAYMVTFRQVDPLFVVDLSNPESPKVLGQLKVTGFSSYLHPFDENHVIGIGKEATEEGRVQGLKIALFDVSDVANPVEKARYEVKEQWSDSNALYDHKAFLFDKERELLVLPVSYTKVIATSVLGGPIGTDIRSTYTYEYWQGAFVFKLNEDEISLRGKIDHVENASEEGNYYWNSAVYRSLFMDDTLYTISRTMVKANDLTDLGEINSVELPYEDIYYFYGKSEVGVFATEGSTGVAVEDSAVESG
jgi:uncharacterized secreted protein with C-terminal beta-propeller domain